MRSIRRQYKAWGNSYPRRAGPPITVKSALVDYLIDKAVFLCFLGGHKMITLAVGFDGLNALAGVPGKDLIEALLDLQYLLCLDLYISALTLAAAGGWWIIISAFGRAIRLPFAPDERRNAPIEAARPTLSWTHRA